MIETLVAKEDRFDSIVSVGEVHEHPSIVKKTEGEFLKPFCPELELKSRRQDNPAAYFPYGVAYIVKPEVLLREKTFYSARNTFYAIQRYQNYEIDDIYDFLAIESISEHRWGLCDEISCIGSGLHGKETGCAA